ncbi:hypothetical protein [Mycolicibacterium aichiense]|uniref:Uncharacterized protein n=1 Tax=Mycolicibacterium aichiense TaxID=1799 RepID=A0AAD1HQK2_9MYCO|nr:hypothetical protein [Mycolicibacterium aichiense]MCV7020151.1 hypothetical protein [Mycolicibacterium aichiense]BBX07746.1 hypothetical protein MAIC_25490 [Mycolicibacterium aichiense]STZ81559.1 Uncharacterised protein [Mycolicibacterium aichiense]
MTQPDDIFDKRYGEVLLVTAGADGPEAAVYNSFPLNDCPAELWDKLDAEAIATEHGAIAALLNGPRHWLMSTIDKVAPDHQEIETFGGIDMIKQATVKLSSMNPAPYTVNHVDRRTVFNFDAGRPVFELVDPQGQRWVMQTYSKAVDRDLNLAALPTLSTRLDLPEGWRYETRTLTERLSVDTTTRDAHVTQDNLGNSYSLEF